VGTPGGNFPPYQEGQCSLCRGELYAGDGYFELEGRVVCEDCLGRWAKLYFAPQRRRMGVRPEEF